MKAVIQRVIRAAVRVDGVTIGEIGRGYLVLLRKMVNLRIFPDEAGKINLSLGDVDGQLLIVSQFTLCADTSRGNRPSFVYAAPPEKANELYEYFIAKARECVPVVQTGSFGADMKVELVNDGPFTIILE